MTTRVFFTSRQSDLFRELSSFRYVFTPSVLSPRTLKSIVFPSPLTTKALLTGILTFVSWSSPLSMWNPRAGRFMLPMVRMSRGLPLAMYSFTLGLGSVTVFNKCARCSGMAVDVQPLSTHTRSLFDEKKPSS